jgi:hypothetical protein
MYVWINKLKCVERAHVGSLFAWISRGRIKPRKVKKKHLEENAQGMSSLKIIYSEYIYI